MRHLMSPLDLSVDELNTLLDLASDIEKHLINTHMSAMIKDWQLYSMSQAPVPVSALKLL